MTFSERIVRGLFEEAGVLVDGSRSWDIRVSHPGFYGRVLRDGSLGLGESFMEGWWQVGDLKAFLARLMGCEAVRLAGALSLAGLRQAQRDYFRNRARADPYLIARHYDLGENLYRAMLGETMQYSCGWWSTQTSRLNAAQLAKMDMICRKLRLQAGMRLLDIGCGFGGLAKYVAERYPGVRVTGVTVSENQARVARELCKGLAVDIQVCDFRELSGDNPFDRVVSVGMLEHVEPKNHLEFFQTVERNLCVSGGIALIHTIGKYRGGRRSDPWIRKYIFPLGTIPTAALIRKAFSEADLCEWDCHDWGGKHYERTIRAWRNNMPWNRDLGWLSGRHSQQFARMWDYYLQSCEAAFAIGQLTVFQFVLSCREPDWYKPIRE